MNNPCVYTAHINVGSNIGDCTTNTGRAIAAVSALSLSDAVVSHPFHSRAWGYDSPNVYINYGIMITTQLAPENLLRKLLEIEHNISPLPHRTAAGEYADRMIDIDLIAMDTAEGSIVIDTPTLTLPHPKMHLRQFVIIPLLELCPEWRHPVYGQLSIGGADAPAYK